MNMNNNPLRQYFRRPAVYLRLPSNGKYYAEGVVELPETGELPIYPMTAIDDITLRTPDALFNGTAVTELISSCVPSIKQPWAINNIDLDAILIAIRSASGDSKLEIESTCPKCDESSTYGIELLGILTQLKSANYDKELKIDELSIKFKPLTYKEMNHASITQFEAQRMLTQLENIPDESDRNKKAKEVLENITKITMELLSTGVEYITTPSSKVDNKQFIYDFLENCEKNTYIKIRDYLSELRKDTEIKPLHIKCVACNHEYEQPFSLNASDFFD